MISIRRNLMAKIRQSGGGRLPAEYQEVEFLQSAGAQCIDTGFSGRSGYSAWYSISFDRITTTLQQVFASTSTGDQRLYFPYAESNGCWAYAYRTVKNTSDAVVASQKYSVFAKLINSEQTVMIDGNVIASGTVSTSIANGTNLYLFAANATNRRYSYAKIYDFRLYDHTEERYVANYVPCYRKADGKPGMYDLTTDSFFVNRNTGADFTVGPDVNY